jgi:hypothetical protein
VHDAYTGAFLFYGHSKAQNDRLSAGATTRRRSLTTEPAAVMPARGAITLLGDTWITGTSNVDGFRGEVIRRVWSLKKSTGLAEIVTPAQAAAGAAGYALHIQCEMSNNTVNAASFSDWGSFWDLYAAAGESAERGQFVRDGSTLYRIRNCYTDVEGFLILESDQFDSDARQSATFITAGVPDLVTDRPTTTSVTLPVVQTDSMKFYRYRTQVEADTRPGDRVVFVASASIAPQPGSQLTMLGSTWRVLTSVIESDARVLRVRLV